jgi:hypothetical protein
MEWIVCFVPSGSIRPSRFQWSSVTFDWIDPWPWIRHFHISVRSAFFLPSPLLHIFGGIDFNPDRVPPVPRSLYLRHFEIVHWLPVSEKCYSLCVTWTRSGQARARFREFFRMNDQMLSEHQHLKAYCSHTVIKKATTVLLCLLIASDWCEHKQPMLEWNQFEFPSLCYEEIERVCEGNNHDSLFELSNRNKLQFPVV